MKRQSVHAGVGTSRRGFTLIETFVGITILLLAIVGPMTIAARGLQTAFYAKEQVAAYYLAQEGVEFVRAVRDENALRNRNWLAGIPDVCRTDTSAGEGCGIRLDAITSAGISNGFRSCAGAGERCRVRYYSGDLDDRRGFYTFSSSDQPTPFTRRIWVQEVENGREAAVVAEVSWSTGIFGGTRSVTIQSRIFNHYDNI